MANTSILAAFERMWQHVVAALDNKSDISHDHDDMYYTETEINDKVFELQTTIDNKADISEVGFVDIDLSNSNEGEANLLNADTLGGKRASEFATLDNIEALRQEILGGAW